MRAMRRVRISRRPRTSALAAVLLVALPLTAAGAVPAAADPVELPVVRSALEADEPCAGASAEHAEAEPWTHGALGMARARPLSQGAGTTVAVVDTGVAEDASGLSGRVSALGDAGQDCVGHGTFAAGLIAAAREESEGEGPAGLAPQARILAVRGADERGVATADGVAAGIREAADGGASVIYVARALPTGKAVLTDAVAYAKGKDALVVAPLAPDSMPRDRSTGGTVTPEPWYWPAAAPGVLAVTDYGPDGKRPTNAPVVPGADLAAPGDAVVSVGPKGDGHFIGSGASLAAANVAGAAALVRARYPRMTAAEVSRQLTEAAYPAAPPRLDPYAALTALLAARQGATPRPEAAVVPPMVSSEPRTRALVVGGVGGAVVLLVAAGAAVIPRGRARGWRPADSRG
ncbi:membrane-anchored mycosin MYCP [Streptomyces sp. LBL]|uniref:S8 family serine peptidase n=1 Tax=Streptomyces sp. LBL TaxID=2940562 RepID=UPI00247521D4|nr:S8 family serine peptidase [Streptomyces sp. LBL]MDH6624492.1 membrane-anchored mycosin MYCP [Streptomyces sp. LBL]